MNLTDYIQGKRRGKEANQLEREAMNDPFLQDAMDGFDAVQGKHMSAIHELKNRVQHKTSNRKQGIHYRLWIIGVAACIILIVGIGILMRQHMQVPNDIVFKAPNIVVAPKKNAPEIVEQQVAEPKKKVLAQRTKKPISTLTLEDKMETKETADKDVERSSVEIADVKASTEEVAVNQVASKKTDNTEHATVLQSLAGRVSGVTVASANGINQKIFGKVVDETGFPLPGVSVRIKGQKTGTITDRYGRFELPAVIDKDKLEASYVGYNKQEILAKADSNIIRIEESKLALSEVVAIGYGNVKRKDITGSLASTSKQGKIFGEKEFKEYFNQHRSPTICGDTVATIQASFSVDKTGKPTDIIVRESTCEALTLEFSRLLKSSPRWTTLNQQVELRMELK